MANSRRFVGRTNRRAAARVDETEAKLLVPSCRTGKGSDAAVALQ